MDYLFILDVITSYSLPTLIIAAIVAAISIVANLIFKDKIPTGLKINAPFFGAMVLCFIYDMVFVVNDFTFREETLTFGLVGGSLSVVLIRTVGSIFVLIFPKMRTEKRYYFFLPFITYKGFSWLAFGHESQDL